jgi:hypothetical protein
VAPQLTSSIAPRSITRSWRQVLFFWGRLLVSMLVWQLFKEVVSDSQSLPRSFERASSDSFGVS